MNSYIDKCCSQCWHSNENPCDLFITCSLEGPLCHQGQNCKEKHQKLLHDLKYANNNIPIIFIGMGTCGLASGADKVKQAIEQELIKKNIKAEIFARTYNISCTGIGLSIVKKIVESYFGKIEVDSVYGYGTTITIKLPIN
ncbi:MAG: CCxxC motif-containing NuoF prefix domain-containing protein [Stygiobacter sp.]